jgi:hypothetical protein
MTQSPTAAWPRWRAHRLAHHDPNDPKPDGGALRAHRLARSTAIAGGRAPGLQAGGLAGWWRRARFDGGGGPSGDRSKLRAVPQKIFYFYAKRKPA